jgi:hypothetical protein
MCLGFYVTVVWIQINFDSHSSENIWCLIKHVCNFTSLSNTMELSPWEASSCSVFLEISNIFGTKRFIAMFTRAHHWSLSWARWWVLFIPSHLVFMIQFNVILPSMSSSSLCSVSFRFSCQNFVLTSLPCMLMPCPSHPPWFYHCNIWGVQIMRLLIQFSPASYDVTQLRSKCSAQHPVLKHPQSSFFS